MSLLLRRRLQRAFGSLIMWAFILGAASGCLGIDKAAQVVIELHDDGISLVKPAGGSLTASGETVITIKNFTKGKRQLVLAKTDLSETELPDALFDAVSPRADARIVAMTAEMKKVKVVILLTVPQPMPSVQKLHVYLRKGQTYLLFDRLGGRDYGMAIQMTPQ